MDFRAIFIEGKPASSKGVRRSPGLDATSDPRSHALGFTLIELLVSVACGTIVCAALGMCSVFIARTFASMSNYVSLDTYSRLAVDKITSEVRQSAGVSSCTSNRLSLIDHDGVALQFIYSPVTKTLTRMKDADSTVLLMDCEAFAFSMFQRNPISGTYDQYPTASPSTCKIVSMDWICARSVLGSIRNSESVQTAKVVIRKQ